MKIEMTKTLKKHGAGLMIYIDSSYVKTGLLHANQTITIEIEAEDKFE